MDSYMDACHNRLFLVFNTCMVSLNIILHRKKLYIGRIKFMSQFIARTANNARVEVISCVLVTSHITVISFAASS
jgi:hypothetical protein